MKNVRHDISPVCERVAKDESPARYLVEGRKTSASVRSSKDNRIHGITEVLGDLPNTNAIPGLAIDYFIKHNIAPGSLERFVTITELNKHSESLGQRLFTALDFAERAPMDERDALVDELMGVLQEQGEERHTYDPKEGDTNVYRWYQRLPLPEMRASALADLSEQQVATLFADSLQHGNAQGLQGVTPRAFAKQIGATCLGKRGKYTLLGNQGILLASRANKAAPIAKLT
jgi:hypothetical protein